jgi:hypothetical protein
MSLISLSPHHLSSRRPRLPGTAHRGPEWRSAVGILRTAIQNAVTHVNWQSSVTADQVGMRVLDHINELNSRALRVLMIVLGILVRASRKDSQQW